MKKSLNLLLLTIAFAGIMQTSSAQTIHVGDTMSFWSVSYIDWPPLWGVPQRVVHGVCKSVGNHCYVFVEDVATQPLQADIDTLVNHFDTHYYPDLTVKYGPVPDVFDNDPKVFILVFDESNWSGYFDPGQQMPDTMLQAHWNMHSNQREMIYVAANSFSFVQEIVAHEFGHMLHWQQDHSPEPPSNPTKWWEEAWVDEGFSTFAAIYLTEDIFQHNVMDNAAYFVSNPDKSLIYFSDYDQVKLFMLFMFEHFGNWNYISTLISNQLNGIDGVNSTLSMLGYTQRFDDAFEQFAIANFIDDTVYAGGKYSYAHYNFASCHVANTLAAFPTGTKTGTVSSYAVDYISFNKSTQSPVFITFDGESGKKFRLDFIKMDNATSTVKEVVSLIPDNNNHISYYVDSLGSAYNKVIMAVMCVDSTVHETFTASYTYSATPSAASIGDLTSEDTIVVFPNPANNTVSIQVKVNLDEIRKIEVFSSQGKLMSSIPKAPVAYDLDISNYPKGVYFVTVKSGKTIFRSRFLKQ
ncbi:MAG: T9SS type A sorting domain-containing protein [Bacteroidota bacterium]